MFVYWHCSEADTGVKDGEGFVIPEDTQLSAEEEEQLQKKTGEVELMLFNSICGFNLTGQV